MRIGNNHCVEFIGKFDLDKTLDKDHYKYLRKFSDTRRVARDAKIAEFLPDPLRGKVNLPLGSQAEYFVGAGDFEEVDTSIGDYNEHPKNQPSLWCQWIPSKDGNSVVWDGSTHTDKYVEWLEYQVNRFYIPWGYVLNGCVKYQGDVNKGEIGRIKIIDNKIEIFDLKVLA